MQSKQLEQQALALHRQGQYQPAMAMYQQVLTLTPNNANVLHLLGILHYQLDRPDLAFPLIEKAVSITPNNADYWNNLGLVYRATQQLEKAIEAYHRSLAIQPNDVDVRLNLGNAFQAANRFVEAAEQYRHVYAANPRDRDVRDALLFALQQTGNQAHKEGHYALAEKSYTEATRLHDKDAANWYNLGNAFRESGKTEQAVQAYRQSIKLQPNDADAHNNLGNALRELGQLDKAIDCYRKALTINPDLHHARVHLLHQLQHICEWDDLDEQISRIRALLATSDDAQLSPFAFLSMPDTTAAEQLTCANLWLKNRYQPILSGIALHERHEHTNKPTQKPHQKIKLGYLSADFRLHPLASLITEVIELHRRDQFEVYGYSYGVSDQSAARARFEQAFDHFVDIRPLSLEECAKRIHADNIDILIDLTGFTQTSRTGIVAYRPAPISVNWLGFPGTMGAYHGKPLFDYLIADNTLIPASQQLDYAEAIAYLPHSYQPNDSKRPVDAHVPTRSELGLPEDGFVFCCFNQTFKIAPAQFACWMRLLKQVPKSVLWLMDCNPWAKQNLIKHAEKQGIDSTRLIFAPRVSMPQHLSRQRQADLVLDTLPYNAHTTASDALWVGVPVITCMGDTFTSRVAASLLRACKLPTLVTHIMEEYEAMALKLATDPVALSKIKQALSDGSMGSSKQHPLFDTEAMVQGVESAYMHMVSRYQAGKAPSPIQIGSYPD